MEGVVEYEMTMIGHKFWPEKKCAGNVKGENGLWIMLRTIRDKG